MFKNLKPRDDIHGNLIYFLLNFNRATDKVGKD